MFFIEETQELYNYQPTRLQLTKSFWYKVFLNRIYSSSTLCQKIATSSVTQIQTCGKCFAKSRIYIFLIDSNSDRRMSTKKCQMRYNFNLKLQIPRISPKFVSARGYKLVTSLSRIFFSFQQRRVSKSNHFLSAL